MTATLIVLDLLEEALITIEEALLLLKAVSRNKITKPAESENQALKISLYLKGEADV